MSSEFEQTGFPLRRVGLFGGGRWSRVLLPVIQSLLSKNAEIVWVTEYGHEHAQNWVIDKQIERVLICKNDASAISTLDAAVVATSPRLHGRQVRALLERGIPTFCEKPFTLDIDEACTLLRTAEDVACPLGVNLEMYFASFIEDFASLVQERAGNGSDVREVEITWQDPWSESRYGELKHGDVYTSIVDDMWPHCWSLLRRLCPDGMIGSIEEVAYEPHRGQVDVVVRFDKVHVKVSLSRRSEGRVRRVEVNEGEAILDFSAEPGTVEFEGARSLNAWRGARPLSRSLSSFFEVVRDAKHTANWSDRWALSVSACLDSVSSAQKIGDELRQMQRARLQRIGETGIELANECHRNLIVDLLLPEYAAKDQRWPAITLEQQIAFTRHVCETQGMRYE